MLTFTLCSILHWHNLPRPSEALLMIRCVQYPTHMHPQDFLYCGLWAEDCSECATLQVEILLIQFPRTANPSTQYRYTGNFICNVCTCTAATSLQSIATIEPFQMTQTTAGR